MQFFYVDNSAIVVDVVLVDGERGESMVRCYEQRAFYFIPEVRCFDVLVFQQSVQTNDVAEEIPGDVTAYVEHYLVVRDGEREQRGDS